MREPSNEQRLITNSVKNGFSVLIDSVAGSGKTTTNLWIAKNMYDKKILLLTYNRRLRLETQERVEKESINNLEVHTYHSFAVHYFDKNCFTDDGIEKFLKADKKFKSAKDFNYDILIIDEAQDMTILYFLLVLNIIRLSKEKPKQLCVLGDKRQSIYEFKNSDERFLSRSDIIFNEIFPNWKKHSLHESFRLSIEMSDFINKVIFKKDFIVSKKKSNIKPQYFICDVFSNGKDSVILKEIMLLINKKGIKPDEIFVISPSVKNEKSPLRQLANDLVKQNINIFVPVNDDEKLDDDLVKDKIVFSTLHQTKGLERKIVIIYTFDDSYFKMFGKNKSQWFCPNILYVALTRATEKLFVIHHYENDYLPFINRTKLKYYADINESKRWKSKSKFNKKKQKINVKDLLRHLSSNCLSDALQYLDINIIREKGDSIKVAEKIKQYDNTYENVSELTKVAIPAYYEYKTKGVMTIYEKIKDKDLTFQSSYKSQDECLIYSDDEDEDLLNKDFIKKDEHTNLDDISVLLKIANHWNAIVSGYNHKLSQIKSYNWLNISLLNKCVARLHSLDLSNNVQYEVEYDSENYPELCLKKLFGFVNCIDNDNIYEFKCSDSITKEHIIQTALLMYLHKVNSNNFLSENGDKKHFRYFIFNIFTNEMVEISSSINNLRKMVAFLFETKFAQKKNKLSDNDFDIKMMNYIKDLL